MTGGSSQSDEAAIISKIVSDLGLPKRFVEFGFHPREFNCIGIAQDAQGMLIDGNSSTVAIARKLLPSHLRIEQRFLDMGNLDFIRDFAAEAPLGVLSIDVDGNDFWFADALIGLKPRLLVLEYNASLGREPVTVPYDSAFDRSKKHASGWYHGASLSAMCNLAGAHGYRLVAVANAGGNAFFLAKACGEQEWPALSPESAYRESVLRNRWAHSDAAEQWAAIRDLPYVRINDEGRPES